MKDIERWLSVATENARAGRPVHEGIPEDVLERLRRRYSVLEDTRDADGFIIGGAHVVTTPRTPRPFLHLMVSPASRFEDVYGSFWSQCCQGFSCLDAVLAGPVISHMDTSYVPTAPRPEDLRHFVLREETPEGVRVWYAFPQVGLEDDLYEDFSCRQSTGWCRLEAVRHGLRSRLLVYVAVDDPVEVWEFSVENLSAEERDLSLFVKVRWDLRSYPSYYFDPRVVSEGRVLKRLGAHVVVNNDRNNTHPRCGILVSELPVESYDLESESFNGGGHLQVFPEGIRRGRLACSPGRQPYDGLISAMQVRLRVPPRTSSTARFVLGAMRGYGGDARRVVEAYRRKYFGYRCRVEFRRVVERWSEWIRADVCRTPDKEFDRFYNVWTKYQAYGASRFVRALDKVGYRDILQDMLGVMSFDADYVREALPVVLRYQMTDGTALRQFPRFEGAPPDARIYMDSGAWIPDTLVSYVEQTGDTGILDEPVGYYDLENNRVMEDAAEPVYLHAMRALRCLFERRGPRGLCHVGYGDWNDALDGLSGGGKEGESVWLSCALVFAAKRMRSLAEFVGKKEDVSFLDRVIEETTRCINEHAWDGEWYVYAFDHRGRPVGSSRNREGKIHLNVNTWALFTGVAEAAGRVDAVLESVSRLETPFGHLLLHPSYTRRSRNVGRIADMVPGQFENGSVYTHAQAFLVYALLSVGRYDEAYRQLKKILPSNTLPDIATGPLHQVSNFAVGPDHPHFGRNLYSNFTGSIAWIRRSMAMMLGVVPTLGGVDIEPRAPSCWGEYEVRRTVRSRTYRVRVSEPGPDGARRVEVEES